MLLVLLNVLIIVVIGALLSYLIDRFVRRTAGKSAQDSCGFDLPCGNPAAIVASAWYRILGGRKAVNLLLA
jgi:hypothetical protein